MSAAQLILVLAYRSLLAHRVKSAVVGGLLLFGTFAVVVGNALLGSIESEMERSLTGSLAGHLQLYAADAKDPLTLFGGFGMGSADVGEIPAVEGILPELLARPEVQSVVPMGITTATVFGRNDIDQVLSDLRDAARTGEAPAVLVARLRRIVDDLATESATQQAIGRPDVVAKTREALDQVSAPAFWTAFDPGAEPGAALAALDTLDAKVAPLASDGRVLYLRVVGTDPDQFATTFPRFHVVEGKPIPPGKPGFLFSHRTYEELVKNPVAAELDRLLTEVRVNGKSIADDPLLQQRVARNANQYRRISFQLEPDEAVAVEEWLRRLLPGEADGDDLDALLRAFLTVDDATIEGRVAAFYEQLAPKIDLYAVPVGSTITLRGFTRSGYMKAVEVPVYGTYEFTGLEDAGLQTASNLVDLVTFRELYGKMSDRDRGELDAIRASVGVADVSRADAEAALFGGGAVESAATAVGSVNVDLDAVVAQDPWAKQYPKEELERGLALNLAVVLKDPSRLEEARAAIAPIAAAHGLQVIDWKVAAGTLGQFVTVMRLVLVVALSIIFLVALIIVNNAMVMATLDRVPEIGTLRAIGAQRSTVLGLFLAETTMLGLVAGGLGAALGVAFVAWLGVVGIPAPAQVLVVLFGGPRLYPTVGLADVGFGLITITVVAVASTLYPAVMAARVPPIVAMQGRD
ncbi:MAG: FtsX-like permease family protein [Myxococcota bacterium]